MRWHRRAASHLNFMSQQPDFVFRILLHFDRGLFELIHFVPDHLHFLDLSADLTFDLVGSSALIFELRSKLFHDLIQASIGNRLHPAVGVGATNSVVHLDGLDLFGEK